MTQGKTSPVPSTSPQAPAQSMVDVQSDRVSARFAIQSVGVMSLKYPLLARDGATGQVQPTIGHWTMGVALPAEQRGTHMSRFIAGLERRSTTEHDLDGHFAFTEELTALLGATTADIEVEFSWFRLVRAPVSGQAAQLESTIRFFAHTGPDASKALQIKVSAKSLCPCSKAVSDRGAHNQRSDITARLVYAPAATAVAAHAQVLTMLEQSASSPIYPLLKREDEKYVTEAAYDNPVFVEDLVRNAATALATLPEIRGFSVEAINRESIHAHDCYARIVHGQI